MSLFSTHEKLYFVFAGEHDRYYLDSMLQMDTHTYLWLELRESKYENIYFVGCLNQKYTIKAIDEVSKQQYNKSCGRIFSKRPEFKQGSNIAQVEADSLREWIDDTIVKNVGQTVAVVFSLEAFAELYSHESKKKYIEKLIKRTYNRNSILLQAPMRLREEQHRILIDPHGVFAYQTHSGESICPELSELLLMEETVELLSWLKKRIGNRFVELGAVTYDRLQSMMRCVRFQREENWSEEQLLEYTNCLYNWWYLSEIPKDLPPKFLRMWSDLFIAERRQENIYTLLFEKLCSSGGWKAFKDRVEKVSKELASVFLYSLDKGKMTEKCHVTFANDNLSNIAYAPWPEEIRIDFIQNVMLNYSVNVPTRDEWVFMQTSLLEPRNKVVLQERLFSMEKYYFYFQQAEKHKDWITLCRAANALIFGGKYLYEESEDFDYGRRFHEYEDYLNISSDYFEMKRVSFDVSTDSVAENGGQFAQQAKTLQYSKILSQMDSVLKVSPQMLKKLDIQELSTMTKEIVHIAEKSIQDGQPLFVEDRVMTAEEADIILQKRWYRR